MNVCPLLSFILPLIRVLPATPYRLVAADLARADELFQALQPILSPRYAILPIHTSHNYIHRLPTLFLLECVTVYLEPAQVRTLLTSLAGMPPRLLAGAAPSRAPEKQRTTEAAAMAPPPPSSARHAPRAAPAGHSTDAMMANLLGPPRSPAAALVDSLTTSASPPTAPAGQTTAPAEVEPPSSDTTSPGPAYVVGYDPMSEATDRFGQIMIENLRVCD